MDNFNENNNKDCCGQHHGNGPCGGFMFCGAHGNHKRMFIRLIVLFFILCFVFWMGQKVGEFKGEYRGMDNYYNSAYQYKAHGMRGTSYSNCPMMGRIQLMQGGMPIMQQNGLNGIEFQRGYQNW